MSRHAYHPHCGCYDCGLSEEAEEAQAERAAEIVDAWMADPVKVAAALDDLAGTSDLNSDGNSHFAADLAELLMSGGDNLTARVYRFEQKVRDYFRDDAEAKLQKWRDEGEEARDAARRAA